jgi:hypothetical protein
MRNYDVPWTWSGYYYGLIEEGMRQDDCLAVCVAHQGRHPFVDGMCHELPKPMSKVDRVRLTLQDRPAAPPPVPVDAEELARGIALALDSLMQRRREQRDAYTQKTAPEPASGDSQPASDQVIIGTPVGRADDGDS